MLESMAFHELPQHFQDSRLPNRLRSRMRTRRMSTHNSRTANRNGPGHWSAPLMQRIFRAVHTHTRSAGLSEQSVSRSGDVHLPAPPSLIRFIRLIRRIRRIHGRPRRFDRLRGLDRLQDGTTARPIHHLVSRFWPIYLLPLRNHFEGNSTDVERSIQTVRFQTESTKVFQESDVTSYSQRTGTHMIRWKSEFAT